ncbi:MAG: tRNA (guanosine(37)-N1)-methyltransferase TrmD [Candidatus Eisenbacteria bacterium]|nr:tRNA (guanosine(37)-N1)-methyltransferase TrmD [Candidatus Eisenbacteria bacterium]
MFAGALDEGLIRIAREDRRAEINLVDLREFTDDPHRSIDDYPYGGGPGMILKVEPVVRALDQLPPPLADRREVVILTPQGERLTQPLVRRLLEARDVVLLFGRYKGLDERIRAYATREVSLGDFILSGGEPAALVLTDALVRLVPGVMGDIESAEGDSFERTLLDSGYYTRPESFRGLNVPEVLLSGHHGRVEVWRREDAMTRTWRRRPDLLERAARSGALTEGDLRWLLAKGWTLPEGVSPPPPARKRGRSKKKV